MSHFTTVFDETFAPQQITCARMFLPQQITFCYTHKVSKSSR